MTYLLDTCVVSEFAKPRPTTRVVDWLGAQEEIGLYLSVITLGELQKGVSKLGDGRKRSRLTRWIQEDLSARFSGRILDIDRPTCERWGQIAAACESDGRPLPVLDGLIAATAMEHDLTLVTRNTRDVEASGVSVVDPWK